MSHVDLLGTGAADGWPNPFCECRSCTAMRAAGEHRGRTAALLDDAILLDCGPDVPAAAARASRSLRSVRHVLVSHGHPDHLDPALLLWRRWSAARGPLTIWAPPLALDSCRPWLAPGDDVELRPIRAGQVLSLEAPGGAYAVTVLAADHDARTGPGSGDALAAEAVLFDIGCPDGGRLLYATDTRSVPDDAHGPFDLVLVEETFGDHADHGHGHLDLVTLCGEVARLRDRGAVTARTDVVAIHLGHHNPQPAQLAARLAECGARAVPDGTRLAVGGSAAGGARRGRSTLVLGGGRSGKSARAEALLREHDRVTYVATARTLPDDAEWSARIEAHRVRRPARWRTVETADVASVLRAATAADAVLVDSLTLWVADRLDDASLALARADLVAAIGECLATLVIVSDEVGMGLVPDTTAGREFRDELGLLNEAVAGRVDVTELVIAGRVLSLPAAARGSLA